MSDRPNRPFVRSAVTAFKLLLVGAALIVIAAISAWLTVRHAVSGRDVLVPDLAGLSGRRRKALATGDWPSTRRPAVRSARAGRRILSQEPPSGVEIKADLQ
jgi:hypothetical protein